MKFMNELPNRLQEKAFESMISYARLYLVPGMLELVQFYWLLAL